MGVILDAEKHKGLYLCLLYSRRSLGDSWREISKPIFWGKYFKMSSAEFFFIQYAEC